MKKLAFLLFAACSLQSASAIGLKYGPEVGLNMSTLSMKFGGESANSDMKIGFRLGGIVDIGINEHIYVQPSVMYVNLGGNNVLKDVFGDGLTWSINYLQVPVNVIYKLGSADANRFFFGLGPYFGFALGGKMKPDGGDAEDLEIGTDEDKDVLKPMDIGFDVKVGYELARGIFIKALYMRSLTNNSPGGDGDNSIGNSCITIGAGWFFGGKK